jgi:predicted nucleic acid-binding protein
MTFFVDANVIVYSAVESEYQAPCLALLQAIVAGADGRTSPAVLEEVWHIERSGRAGDMTGLAERAYRIFTPLLAVTDEALRLALALDAGRAGTNDRVHAGTCLAHDIATIVTADRGFDAVAELRRVDPLDADDLDALLPARF